MRNTPNTVVTILLILMIAITCLSMACSKNIATVNSEAITEKEFNERLRQQAGKQILDEMITEKLIVQESKDKKIKVSTSEINGRVSEIKNRFPDEESFNKNLEENNLTLNQLKEQIKIQILIEKLVAQEIKITEEMIKNYYEQNKSTRYQGKELKEVSAEIEEQLEQEKINSEKQALIEDLKRKTKIENKLK